MVLRADVLHRAWLHARETVGENARTIYLSPQGSVLTQKKAKSLAEAATRDEEPEPLILVCGHYEGVDERFVEVCVNEELSIGDFVLTGGELPAAVLVDALSRWIPGVLGNEESAEKDSLSESETSIPAKNKRLTATTAPLLKYPQYTRPAIFQGLAIPEILTSGNHGKVEAWRKEKRIEVTKRKRPDLLSNELPNDLLNQPLNDPPKDLLSDPLQSGAVKEKK